MLASTHGIFAAQSVLRHAQIATTAAYYVDKKRRISAGLGSLLTDGAKVIEGSFNSDQTTPQKRNPATGVV